MVVVLRVGTPSTQYGTGEASYWYHLVSVTSYLCHCMLTCAMLTTLCITFLKVQRGNEPVHIFC